MPANQTPAHDNGVESIASYGVVILYFRRGRDIVKTIRAVQEQLVPPARIVLVDNASDDGVLAALEAEHELTGVEVVSCPVNGGYAAGMNVGARTLGTSVDYVLFLTHEVLMDSDCAKRLLVPAVATDAALLAPSLRLPGGGLWSNGGRVTRLGAAVHVRSEVEGDIVPVDWLDGACVLARRDALTSVGGFDERYFVYWEDVDLSLAMRAEGLVAVVPGAVAHQAPSSSHPPIYYYARNRLLLWRKQRNWGLLAASLPGILGYAVYRAFRVRPGDLTAALRGIFDGLAR